MDHVATSTPRDNTSQFTTTQTFESKEELIKWAKEVGRSNDITVVVLRSDKKKPRVTLGCEKSGKYDTRYTREKPMTDKKGRRNTGTKKSDCPFRLTGKKLPAGDEWELTVVEGKHNHEAKDTIRKQGHSFQGRLSQEEKSLVKDWRETGKQPKEILEDLKKRDTHNKSTARTILNECQRLERYSMNDKFLKDLQGWIENDNVNVKQSLKSENYDGYGFPELKGLYGTVSRRALTLLREQTDVARRIDVDNGENCRCAIRSTHGLPCAHQIAKYRREGRPIPPECINSHWRTLQLKPLRETGEPSVEGRVKRRKLSDKKNTDTHFVLPLPDDIVESERNSPNAGPSIVPSTQDRQPDDEVSDIQSTNKLLELVNVSPLVLRPYVLDVKDVPRDGHCGFSTIASLLGITDEDGRPGWVKVREDLRKELKFHRDHYAHLFGSKHEVDDLLHRLDYFLIPCPEKEHWMIMPEMGHIIASCYGVVLILLSSVQNQCFTFFPLQTAPTFVSSPAEIAIGFCDEHFVQVLFKENHRYTHPMPPPAALLTKREPSDFDRHQQQRSREWATRYDARMKQFSSYLQPMVVSHENPIVLDTVSSMDIF